jgi:hypothetical protein
MIEGVTWLHLHFRMIIVMAGEQDGVEGTSEGRGPL